MQSAVNIFYLLADNIKNADFLIGDLQVSILTSILDAIKYHKEKSESEKLIHGLFLNNTLIMLDDIICELLHLLEAYAIVTPSSLMHSGNLFETLFEIVEECMYSDSVKVNYSKLILG